MKIRIDTATLTRELFKVQGVVSNKSTLPISHNALFEANADGTLAIHATDLDVNISSVVPCEVEMPGRMTVRAKDLFNAVKNLKSDSVVLSTEDSHNVQLTAGTVRARMVGQSPDEFPALMTTDGLSFVTVKTQRLMRMIDRTIFSISTDEGRPNLTGAKLEISEDNDMRMVSTDGHRLSVAQSRVDVDYASAPKELKAGIIVPRKGLQELRRSVDLAVETVELAVDATHMIIRQGPMTLFIRVIDGVFPDFSQVMPTENPERKAMVSRAELMDRVKFVSLFASDRTHNLRLAFEGETCIISASDPDKGECEERIPITYAGPEVRAGYNFRYVIDVLNVVSGDQVSMEIVDSLSPTVIRELDVEEGDDSIFIVMPMRL